MSKAIVTVEEVSAREYVLECFSIDKDGRITTPGMFKGERIYAPYFYEVVTNGEVGEVSTKPTELKRLTLMSFPNSNTFTASCAAITRNASGVFRTSTRSSMLICWRASKGQPPPAWGLDILPGVVVLIVSGTESGEESNSMNTEQMILKGIWQDFIGYPKENCTNDQPILMESTEG
jgi:hypothetical protein